MEYYKLQKTFEGAIQLDNKYGVYVPAKQKGKTGLKKKSTLDEIIEKINEKYKGKFTEADRVILGALHDKLIKNKKLFSSAISTDSVIFSESIFPSVFSETAMESYTESEESYRSIFEDKNKYQAIMGALAEGVYRELRKKMDDMPLDMAAEEEHFYGNR